MKTFHTAIKANTQSRNKAKNPEEAMTMAAAGDKFAHAGTDKGAACIPPDHVRALGTAAVNCLRLGGGFQF